MTFTAKGLLVRRKGKAVEILREGSIRKFKKHIAGISFSAKNAFRKKQRVLYVTERCVFELTTGGLKLLEVYEGIDEQRQVRDLLDFAV